MNLLKSAARPVLARVRAPRSPAPDLLDVRSYRAIEELPSFTPGQTRLFGRTIAFSDKDGFLHSLREIFVDEVYRFDSAKADPFIMDAGANIGLSVLYFKQRFPAATVMAFEPDPQMFDLLRRNTAGLPGVELRNAAAWTADTTLTFFTEGSLAGSTEIDFLNKGRAVTVAAERLRDRLVERPVDFLKIDIEGAENEVLPDIADALDRVGLLFFEYHSAPGRPQRLGELLQLICDQGFRYVINGAHGARLPFVETVPHGFELQLNVSCFRPARPG